MPASLSCRPGEQPRRDSGGSVPVPLAFNNVDGLRGGYPDDQEGRWFPGDRGYGERYEEERYRVPDPRHSGPERDDPRSPIGPRSGVELPPLHPAPPPYVPEPAYPADPPYPTEPPLARESAYSAQSLGGLATQKQPPPPVPFPPVEEQGPTGQFHTQSIDRASLQRPPQPTVYRARRAGIVGALVAVAGAAQLPLIRVLLAGEFGHTVAPRAVLGGLFAMTAGPPLAMGMYRLQ